MTGRPGVDLPDGWDAIPGARGCIPESCGFRDHHAEFRAAGATAVYGLSSQSAEYQSELADRLALPFGVLADPELQPAEALDLPTVTAGDDRLYKRLTLIITERHDRARLLPDLPARPARRDVLDWLRAR
jgi:peroxiredoxin